MNSFTYQTVFSMETIPEINLNHKNYPKPVVEVHFCCRNLNFLYIIFFIHSFNIFYWTVVLLSWDTADLNFNDMLMSWIPLKVPYLLKRSKENRISEWQERSTGVTVFLQNIMIAENDFLLNFNTINHP